MIEQEITHHIQKYIISVLYRQKIARFKELRKTGVDTNLFSYHLKLLVTTHMVKKVPGGYTLDEKGLAYVDRVSEKNMRIRTQPKIVTMLVVQNSDGDILLQRRAKQPHIDTWTLPYGKLHIEDSSTLAAAVREAREKLDVTDAPAEYAGDCYIRVVNGDKILSTTLVHVFRFESDAIAETETTRWARPHKLNEYDLAPAVEQIVTRTFFRDPLFFEEYTVNWEPISTIAG